MDREYAQRYAELYRNHWWWRAREQVILKEIRRQPLGPRPSIFDVGCGAGLFFDRLADFGDVEGIEPNAAAVSGDNPHRSRIHLGPFDETFEPGKRYSLMLMLDVLEHMSDPVAAVRHALRLLQPGGRLLVTVPAFMPLWTLHDDLNHHLIRYTKRSFRPLAAQAGLRIERIQYFFYWTVPVKLGIRLAESCFGLEPSVPRVPPWVLNQTMYGFSRLEDLLLGFMPIPVGSSLLVSGRPAAQ